MHHVRAHRKRSWLLELIHNFTLVHDDIQDGDATRRHRPTVWAIWGEAQGINAGDGLFATAFMALLAPGPRSDRRMREVSQTRPS